MSTPQDEIPEEELADITPVMVRCVTCSQTWEEFKAVADTLFTPDTSPSTPPRYVADGTSCVFCNHTPGETWRQGPYL